MNKYMLYLISWLIIASAQHVGFLKLLIFDKATGNPLPYPTVYVKEAKITTLANEDGLLTLRLPEGKYSIEIWATGYDTTTVEVDIKPGITKNIKVELVPKPIKLGVVTVRAKAIERKKTPAVSLYKITRKQLVRLPVFGKPDIIQYLQTLPGVITTGDAGGKIFIRGGTPVQILTLLDGIPVYSLQHSVGFFSVIPTYAVGNVIFYAGGFPSEYGSRLSSVIDIRTRAVSRQPQAILHLNPVVSEAVFNLPISQNAGFLIAGQLGYLDYTQRLLYRYVDSPGLPYRLYDLLLKFEARSKAGNRISIFGFLFSDSILQPQLKYKWNNTGFGLRFVISPENTRFFLTGLLGYSQYNSIYQPGGFLPSQATLSTFHGEIHANYPFPDQTLKFGVQLTGAGTSLRFHTLYNTLITYQRYTSEIALYIKYRRLLADKMVIEPGLRAHFYASESIILPEPRLQIKWLITPSLRLKGAAGVYTQSLFTTTANYEATYLFVGYLNLPEESIPFRGKLLQQRIQTSADLIAGIEFEPSDWLFINLEAYRKWFIRLFSVNRYKIFPQDPNYMAETGWAHGIDAQIEIQHERFDARATYSLLLMKKQDQFITYTPWFARTHTINISIWAALDKASKWQAGIRWIFGSGLFFTPVGGFYPAYDFSAGIFSDPITGNYDFSILLDLSQYNAKTLPPYHRLDVSIERKFQISRQLTLTAFISIFNIYNRYNILFVNRVTGEILYQLPALPIAGLRLNFNYQ